MLTFGRTDEDEEWTTPLTSPRLTGFLELCSMVEGFSPTVDRLLGLPNGLNFTKIAVVCLTAEDFDSTTGLVSGCSNTLESLKVTGHLEGLFPSPPGSE